MTEHDPAKYDPPDFEHVEAFKSFWAGLPGRSKHLLRRFRPGRPLRVKPEYPHIGNFSPHPVIGWIHGVTADKPPRILFLPVFPGMLSQLLKDGVVDFAMQQALIDKYAIAIEPEWLEEVPP